MPEKKKIREKRSKNKRRVKRNGLQDRTRENDWSGVRDEKKNKS